MKVKTLLKTLNNVEYCLQSEAGWTLENGYVSTYGYANDSDYEDFKIVSITTVQMCDRLFITAKP